MEDSYTEKYEILIKEIESDSKRLKGILSSGLEELIMLKWPCYI